MVCFWYGSRCIRDANYLSYYWDIYSAVISYEAILQTYTLEEIFELNDLTEDEVLEFLVEQEFVTLPEILPV